MAFDSQRHQVIRLELPASLRHVICVGAHPDDIEIGAAATLSMLAERIEGLTFTFVILSGDETRDREARASAEDLLGDRVAVHHGRFRDGHLPYDAPGEAKDFLRSATEGPAELVVAPNRMDLHQDHAFAADLAHQVYRDHLILGYEIVKSDGDLGRPQVYNAFDADVAERKVAHLMTHFQSQSEKPWYTPDAFGALMRLRGVESGSPHSNAEAFYVSKLLLG
jgi:LmbE family N-acetylglucosaminyl deacetylase